MSIPLRPNWILSSVILLSFWCPARPALAEPEPSARWVSVVIDYNDGVQKHFKRVAWQSGLTVLDAMQIVGKHPRGIRFSYRGKGARALLYRIDDLENESNGHNWIYRINGTLADRSFGIRKIKQGDTILWKYEKFQ